VVAGQYECAFLRDVFPPEDAKAKEYLAQDVQDYAYGLVPDES
jgi:hypothetical protein